ncbi:MAG: tRNA (adenosine(37)-N6)-threonylcarbamoyltransferase complex ATPase subunit type 1 TsaE [Rhodospirillales bacterium]|nr:tRNA (adenosine(37)-N6)-threonylcarbamoyltransferase complex ATPase subunit type 1 TsaE [Rhodospirillales bacterium]MDE0379447.1 tRNA (adenosine(37)-N6)-threonylcarbamoyltransferase complex ATPase subunit type 1 TsaE [Rhodospirillales bacterium]
MTARARSLAETESLAAALAPHAAPGDVIGLCGALGSGKTAFARAFIRARLGRRSEEVPSPTFTLVQLYDDAAGAIWHFDLYRLGAPEDVYELGIEDAFSGAISLIEWPEKLGSIMPGDWLQVHLAPGEGEEERLVTITPHGCRARALTEALAEDLERDA